MIMSDVSMPVAVMLKHMLDFPEEARDDHEDSKAARDQMTS